MSENKTVLQKIRDYTPLILQLVGLIVVVLNLWLFSKLAPIEQGVTVMAQKVDSIEKNITVVQNQHEDFVRKDTFDVIVERINHISNRVDQIYGFLR